jgi:C1A family cysteine protease
MPARVPTPSPEPEPIEAPATITPDRPRVGRGLGLGWVPDLPDVRDYTPQHAEVAAELKKLDLVGARAKASGPATVDLRAWCSPIENQGSIGSCTANAAVGLVEYFQRLTHEKHTNGSRLFLYKATRNLLHLEGDTGAYLRSTVGALRLFGLPPEEYYPYDVRRFDEEPPAFCYAFAENFKAIKYVRLDANGQSPEEVLVRIKTYLGKRYPSIFGFTVYDTIDDVGADGKIPFPGPRSRALGGHAVMAVGYDDSVRVKVPQGPTTQGALLIRNSWGTTWGDHGYGWLPYEYVTEGLALDWWTLLKQGWVDTGVFTRA